MGNAGCRGGGCFDCCAGGGQVGREAAGPLAAVGPRKHRGAGSWRCKNEAEFVRFQRLGDGWAVTDRSGRTYTLGQYPSETDLTRLSRAENATAGSGFGATYQWYVDGFVDTHGNRIDYFYS